MALNLDATMCGPLGNNVYVWWDDDSRECMLIDPGIDSDGIADDIDANKFILKYIINTHCHFDHTYNNRFFKDKYPSSLLLMHRADEHMLHQQTAMATMFDFDAASSPDPDAYISEGGVLHLGKHQFEILELPGHSPGSVGILHGKDIVLGDVIFAGSVGRTDLPGGDMNILVASIKEKLFKLPPDTKIYPGHGPSTTIRREKHTNPFLK